MLSEKKKLCLQDQEKLKEHAKVLLIPKIQTRRISNFSLGLGILRKQILL